MQEWIKKIIGQIKGLWSKWSLLQKLILIGICIAAIGGIIALFSVSSSPTMVPVIDAPIRDEDTRDRIVTRINQEGVRTSVTPAGMIMVTNEASARRMRAILIREDLIPQGTDPWAIFDKERWTIDEITRNVNFQRAITQLVTDHIKALDDVDNANVTLVFPKEELFRSDQNPVSASVIITPRPGSDITENRKKIEGIQKLLKFAVEGLKDENIVITDQNGLVLNDFSAMAGFTELDVIQKGQKMIRTLETQYRAAILESLQSTFTADRVRDLNIKIDMDLSKKSVTSEEYGAITLKPRTPGSSYDDSQIADHLIRSQTTSTVTWEGTGTNPEGPAGTEGQTPPAFRDMDVQQGKMTQQTSTENRELNKKVITEEKSPTIDRVTVSVNIDGVWKIKYDDKGKPVELPDGTLEREYTPISPEQLRSAEALIQNAIGYNAGRGDSVTVQNIPFDRTREFFEADNARKQQGLIRLYILIGLVAFCLLLIGFVVFRMVSREMERRRRVADEERARREEALRQSALMQAEEEGTNVTMSVEERTRMEMHENIANMAKDHPEDVAQLIRTWLLEE